MLFMFKIKRHWLDFEVHIVRDTIYYGTAGIPLSYVLLAQQECEFINSISEFRTRRSFNKTEL